MLHLFPLSDLSMRLACKVLQIIACPVIGVLQACRQVTWGPPQVLTTTAGPDMSGLGKGLQIPPHASGAPLAASPCN